MESSRKEDQIGSRYKRSWYIQVLHSRMSRKVLCREQRKRGQETKGCLGDRWEEDNSGEAQSDPDGRFLPLSLSIFLKRKIIACSGGCKAVVDTRATCIEGLRTMVDNIQKLIGATPRDSKGKGNAPGSLPVSTHNRDLHT